MEIWNTGTLQTNLIRLEDLKKVHQSHPRNELIAKVLYDTGLVENWVSNRQLHLCFNELKQFNVTSLLFFS